MKKLLSTLLALAMVLSVGVTAFALEEWPPDEAADLLAELTLRVPADGVVLPTWYILAEPEDKMKPGIEDGDNPDNNDLNDTVLSGSTLYIPFVLSDAAFQENTNMDHFNNEFWKIKATAEDGSKYISSIKVVEKKLDGLKRLDAEQDGWDAGDWNGTGYTKGKRWWVLEIKLKEFPTDDEYKISFKLTSTAKKPIEWGNRDVHPDPPVEYAGIIPAGTKCTVYTAPFWVSNRGVNADADFAAGSRGEVLKPSKNEDNAITWEDNNHTLAWLDFTGDDDGKIFYPKMKTQWDDQEYAERFADQDAYLYDFLFSPKLAATSRATLKLRIPFVDEDGELSADPEEIMVCQKIDGELSDITASGKIRETDDGDWVFETKVRSLGAYIIAQKPAPAAEESAAAVDPAAEAPEAAAVKRVLPSFAK